MRLGEHTITVRRVTPRTDGNGRPVRDPYGDPLTTVTDTEVPGCLVTPTRRQGQNEEPQDRAAPAVAGMSLYAPPGTDLTADDLLLWQGRTWQVHGEPWLWDECVEARIRRSS